MLLSLPLDCGSYVFVFLPVKDAARCLPTCEGVRKFATHLVTFPEPQAIRRRNCRLDPSVWLEDQARQLLNIGSVDLGNTTNAHNTLRRSCAEGRLEALNVLLRLFPDVDLNSHAVPRKGWHCFGRPLHLAVSRGQRAIVRRLIRDGRVDIGALSRTGKTILHLAVIRDDLPMVELVLSYRRDHFDINAISSSVGTAFYSAVANERVSLVDRLLEEECLNVFAGSELFNPLASAAKLRGKKTAHVFEKLLAFPGADEHINAGRVSGTPLTNSLSAGNSKVWQRLFKFPHLDLNKSDSDGWTPLQLALCHDVADIATKLIRNTTVDVNARNRFGHSALEVAASRCDNEMVECLLKRSDLDVHNSKPWKTALSVAIYGQCWGGLCYRNSVTIEERMSVIKTLFDDSRTNICEDVDVENHNVLRSCMADHYNNDESRALVEWLLSHEYINRSVSNYDCQYLLWHAVWFSQETLLIRILQEDSVDTNKYRYRYRDRNLLLDAVERGFVEGVALLLDDERTDVGAAVDNRGRTALQLATEQNKTDIVEVFRRHRNARPDRYAEK